MVLDLPMDLDSIFYSFLFLFLVMVDLGENGMEEGTW